MADDTITPTVPETTPAQDRIIELSGKVKTVSDERDTALTAKQDAEKRAVFAESFVDVLANYPAAKDHKDEIKAKVLAGLSTEDATYAVLGKAGKLGGTQTPVVPTVPQSPAGGSAPTTITSNAEKTVAEMSLEEKRTALSKELIWQ